MSSPLVPLLGSNLRSWLSAKGFWLVAATALLPLVLTGAWVGTHRADVEARGLEIPDVITQGENVTFRATIANVGPTSVGPFNASLSVVIVTARFGSSETEIDTLAETRVLIDGMEPGATRELTLSWNATPGFAWVVAYADADEIEAVGEVDEFNNEAAEPIAVRYVADAKPRVPPAGLAGPANATRTTDLAIESLRRPAAIAPGDNVTFEATVVNRGTEAVSDANVTLRVGRGFGDTVGATADSSSVVSLGPGESTVVRVDWTAVEGTWWQEAFVQAPTDTRDASPADNHKAESFTADPKIPADYKAPEIPERLTVKQFYVQVLSLLHFRLLIPLIALFYAGGVIADERDRGSLPYLLTRPLPRWLIPITKFAASFAVASLALVVGLVLTYALLFQAAPEGSDVGYLATPILAALLTLFVYGALFTLLGIWVARPYLVGVAFVLGWENFANLFVPWVRNLTITQHLTNALVGTPDARDRDGWAFDQGLQWVPEGEVAMRAFLLLLAVGFGLLAWASVEMKRREFEV